MRFDEPIGLIAVLLALVSFYGMTYVVIALNVGWRFGYWMTSACMGGIMLFMSVFWVTTALGPRGSESRWIPLAAARDQISQASLDEQALSSPGSYPGGGWSSAEEGDTRLEALGSAVTNCLSVDLEGLEGTEHDACETAQGLMPVDEQIPIIDGNEVAVQPDLADVRFIEENGAVLGQATVIPLTKDPRIAEDPTVGAPLGESFRLVSVLDKGSIRLPAFVSLAIWSLYFAFHLRGLHRAEKRKLSPVA